MIFYFSGTGNSKWIARTVAKALGDKAVNLVGADAASYSFTKDDYLGIVFPVFYDAAPPPVLEFAAKLQPNGAYTFAISNYANYSGYSLQQLSKDCLRLNSGYGMVMPGNTAHMGHGGSENEESSIAKLKLAPYLLNQIIARLRKREDGVFDAIFGDNAEHKTLTRPAEAWEKKSFTAPFSVTKDNCTSCERCAKNCPHEAIEMIGGYPVWVKDKCLYCMACICYCPTAAIEYGTASQGVYRYTFEKYFPKAINDELMRLSQIALER